MSAKCQQQIRNVEAFRAPSQDEADVVGAQLRPATSPSAVKVTARNRKNVFPALMGAAKTRSPGQMRYVFYEVGDGYRRNM